MFMISRLNYHQHSDIWVCMAGSGIRWMQMCRRPWEHCVRRHSRSQRRKNRWWAACFVSRWRELSTRSSSRRSGVGCWMQRNRTAHQAWYLRNREYGTQELSSHCRRVHPSPFQRQTTTVPRPQSSVCFHACSCLIFAWIWNGPWYLQVLFSLLFTTDNIFRTNMSKKAVIQYCNPINDLLRFSVLARTPRIPGKPWDHRPVF